jgi:TatA/E family protein of Tat protein translocase
VRRFGGSTPGRRTGRQRTERAEALNLGPTELLVVLAIFMLLFGAARLPKLARSLGESAKEFKNATTAIDSLDHPSP